MLPQRLKKTRQSRRTVSSNYYFFYFKCSLFYFLCFILSNGLGMNGAWRQGQWTSDLSWGLFLWKRQVVCLTCGVRCGKPHTCFSSVCSGALISPFYSSSFFFLEHILFFQFFIKDIYKTNKKNPQQPLYSEIYIYLF